MIHRPRQIGAFDSTWFAAARGLFSSTVLVAVLLANGCRRQAAAPPPPPTPVVAVLEPVQHPVQEFLEYNGYLDAVESVQVRARVQGFLEEIRFKEGQEVKRGDLLFRIDPREARATLKKAEADKAKAAAEVTNARSEETRAQRLLQNRTISGEEYQSKLAAKEAAEATVKQTVALAQFPSASSRDRVARTPNVPGTVPNWLWLE